MSGAETHATAPANTIVAAWPWGQPRWEPLAVVGKGYFDHAGSTITFSTRTHDGDLFLHQSAISLGGNSQVAWGIVTFNAQAPSWTAQGVNLRGELMQANG